MPPWVARRWMLVVRPNTPLPVADRAVSSSQGMAPAVGLSTRALTAPTTVLPSSASQVGPA